MFCICSITCFGGALRDKITFFQEGMIEKSCPCINKKSQSRSDLKCRLWFLFYRFCTFSHLDDFGIINFAWSVFQNISDFRRISPTEKCRVIFLLKSARPVLNHHFLTAVHTVNREKHSQGFCIDLICSLIHRHMIYSRVLRTFKPLSRPMWRR